MQHGPLLEHYIGMKKDTVSVHISLGVHARHTTANEMCLLLKVSYR